MRRWLIINTAVIAGVAALAVAFIDFRRGGEPSISVTGAVKRDEAAAPKDGRKAQRAIAVESAVARAVTASTDFRSIGSLQSDEFVQIASEIAGRVDRNPVQRRASRSRPATCSSSSMTRSPRPR